ncbi:MAG: YeeE/YedE family protein [Proteobacteria bacterium]|nr:YeeE/YedE family protein [Pseudomonadota bacterium]MCP4919919.1 YeeE/YedE family protein [Pseudomonadota bacterium]
MEHFTPWSALAGGALIGLASSALLLFNGRIAGISGILAGLLAPRPGDSAWRAAFAAGLLVAGLGLSFVLPDSIAGPDARSLFAVGAAGLIVGFGVRMGNGCTSGHGVCGLSRFSIRSLVATLTFMGTGILTAITIELGLGGSL